MDERAAVLVGVGADVRRDDDVPGPTYVDLMVTAAERAFEDAGIESKRTGAILVPRGSWGKGEPEHLVAERLGAGDAHTVMAEFGIPQLSIIRRACELIADGTTDVALVVGGEARHRARVLQRAGAEGTAVPIIERAADENMKPKDDFMTRPEIERRLNVAAHQYAVIESTLRAAAGRTPPEHSAHLGRLWGRFAEIAASNPEAWDQSCPSPEQIANAGTGNRMLAAPYTKFLCSQMNVDMSAAMVIMSAGAAEALGVPREKWVFPLAFGESNLMMPMPTRRDIHRWPAFAIAAEQVFERTGLSIGDIGPVDLYSCFPAAVQTFATELGLPADRDLTVTGGMTFGGGPLNHYTFHAVVTMARLLRAAPGTVGLTTSVSGLLTKPAVGLWSTERRDTPMVSVDVTEAATKATAKVEVDGDATGTGPVVGCTVLYDGSEPTDAVAVVQIGDVRTVALTQDAAVIASMLEEEWVGRDVRVATPGVLG